MPTTRTLTAAVGGALLAGIALGALVTLGATSNPAQSPTAPPAPVTCDEFTGWADRTLANYDVALDLWESGAAYAPEFRAENLDALAFQVDNLACN